MVRTAVYGIEESPVLIFSFPFFLPIQVALVTSKIALDFIKNKNGLLQKFVGIIFIAIGLLLLIEMLV